MTRWSPLLGLVWAAATLPAQAPAFVRPALPQASVDTTLPAGIGRTIRIPAGDNAALQAALDSALGTDVIVLPDGAVFTGPFWLSHHSGSSVTLRSATVPPAGRVDSALTTLATLLAPTGQPALTTRPGANDWRLLGIRVGIAPGSTDNYGIVILGSGAETTVADQPAHIVLDRVIINADTNTTSRCLTFNGAALAVIHSALLNCHSRGRDAQAVGGWSGAGPFLIADNLLIASTEIIAFGGADTRVPNQTPSDITIVGNTLTRPLAWARGPWLVKNFFELKIGERVLFANNTLENNWADGQIGHAILFQTVNQEGTTPWAHISDVTIRHNTVRSSTHGITLIARFNNQQALTPMARVVVDNNAFTNIGPDPITGTTGARFFQLLGDLQDVTITQNSFDGTGAAEVIAFDQSLPPMRGLTVWNNKFAATTYGIFGGAIGTGALTLLAPGAVVRGNVFTAQQDYLYPPGNYFPDSLSQAPTTNDGFLIGAVADTVPPVSAPPVVVPPPQPPPVPVPTLRTCQDHPVGYVVTGGAAGTTAGRSEVTTISRGADCLGVITLNSATTYRIYTKTCAGTWVQGSTPFLTRWLAQAVLVKVPACQR